MTDRTGSASVGTGRLLDLAIFILALSLYATLTIIDGARSPALHLWFSVGFIVLLALRIAVRGAAPSGVDLSLKFSLCALAALACVMVMQLNGVGPFVTFDPLRSWQTLFLFAGYAAAFVLFRLQLSNPGRVLALGVLILAIAVLQTLFGMINIASSEPLLGWAPTHYAFRRVTGTYVNRNFYAGLVAMSSGLLLAWILVRPAPSLRGRGRFSVMLAPGLIRIVTTLTVLFLITGMMLSGSRAAVFGFGGACSLLLVFAIADPALRPGGWGLLLLGSSTAALFVISLVGKRFTSLHIDMSDRLEQWRATLAMLKERWLTGYGAGSYENVFRSRQSGELTPLSYTHAHNDYLETMMETGTIGIVLLSAFLVPIMYGGVRRLIVSRSITRKRGILGAIFGIVVMLVHGLLDFPFQVPANVWLFMVLVAMLSSLSTMDFRRFTLTRSNGER